MTPADTPETTGNGDAKGTSVIVNAIAVLRTFTADEPLLGVTEIANRVGLHKSTVSRILATFEQEHLVERDPETRRFRLGLGLIAVAGPLLAELEERRVAYPVLRELTEQTGETSALMVWNGAESMCVEQIASHHQIKHSTPLGARYTDAMSASVQVFLSAAPAERVRTLLRSGAISYPGLDDSRPERLPDQAHGCDGPWVGHQLRRILPRRSRRGCPCLRPPRRRRGGCPDLGAPLPRLPGTAAGPGRSVRGCGRQDHQPAGRPRAPQQRLTRRAPGLRRRTHFSSAGPAARPDATPRAGPCAGGGRRTARRSAAAVDASTAVPRAVPWPPGPCCTRNPATWPGCQAAGNCVAHRNPGARPAAGARSSAVGRGPRIPGHRRAVHPGGRPAAPRSPGAARGRNLGHSLAPGSTGPRHGPSPEGGRAGDLPAWTSGLIGNRRDYPVLAIA